MRDEIVPCIGRDLYDATGVHLRYLVSRQEHLNTDHFQISISVIDHGFRGLEKKSGINLLAHVDMGLGFCFEIIGLS